MEKIDDFVFSLDGFQTMLGAAGFAFPPADLVNAFISLCRGDYLDAGLNVQEAIPLIGESVATGRASSALNKGTKMIESMRYTFRATGDPEELSRGIREALDQLDAAMGARYPCSFSVFEIED